MRFGQPARRRPSTPPSPARPGSSTIPVCSAVMCRLPCRNTGSVNDHGVEPDAHHDAEHRAHPHLPVAQHAEVDHRVVGRAARARRSAAPPTTPITVERRMISRESNQSSRWPCSSTYCSAPTLTASSAMPAVVDRPGGFCWCAGSCTYAGDHHRREHADRDVDVEDPGPAVVVGQPAAQRGPDRRARPSRPGRRAPSPSRPPPAGTPRTAPPGDTVISAPPPIPCTMRQKISAPSDPDAPQKKLDDGEEDDGADEVALAPEAGRRASR